VAGTTNRSLNRPTTVNRTEFELDNDGITKNNRTAAEGPKLINRTELLQYGDFVRPTNTTDPTLKAGNIPQNRPDTFNVYETKSQIQKGRSSICRDLEKEKNGKLWKM
jgi:hypothetical protein